MVHKEVIKKINKLRGEKLTELGLSGMSTLSTANLKYLNTKKNNHSNLERFWEECYEGTKQDKILDFGCGGGRYLFVGRELGYNVIGLDINQKLFGDDIFERLHEIYGIEKYITFYDGINIPFEENSFDVILFCISITKDFIFSEKEGGLSHFKCLSRLEQRIKNLIKISNHDAVWHIIPNKHIKEITPFFDKFNNKNLKIRGFK